MLEAAVRAAKPLHTAHPNPADVQGRGENGAKPLLRLPVAGPASREYRQALAAQSPRTLLINLAALPGLCKPHTPVGHPPNRGPPDQLPLAQGYLRRGGTALYQPVRALRR